MFHLIYISRSVRLLSEQEIYALLEESRWRNQGRKVTGMLLYIQDEAINASEGRFIQVLEGDELDVRSVFEKIRNDPRHHHISIVDETTKTTRDFETWTMGFEHLKKSEYDLTGLSFGLDKGFLKQGHPGKINIPLGFLRSFYSMKEGLLKRREEK